MDREEQRMGPTESNEPEVEIDETEDLAPNDEESSSVVGGLSITKHTDQATPTL